MPAPAQRYAESAAVRFVTARLPKAAAKASLPAESPGNVALPKEIAAANPSCDWRFPNMSP